MNVALQRRRLAIALGITAVCIVIALAAVVGAFGFHIGWMMWVFAGAIVGGFASHAWLMLGVMRERPPS
ncbi:MAG: hypothetical protein ACHP7N_08095 [Caulobacterales bacterium]